MPPWRPPVHKPPGAQTRQQANQARMERDRGKRMRGRAAMARKAFVLTLAPLCAECELEGKVTAATELDHVIPVSAGGSDWDVSNLRGLCHAHHLEKTLRERRR